MQNLLVHEGTLPADFTSAQPPLSLIIRLCQALADENISYCHWKSNNALDRSASGENDLDLLVSSTDVSRFMAVLSSLGFKHAVPVPEKQMVGVESLYGYDESSGKLVHVHAHFRLVLGHDMTKNFRLPFEAAYLNSAVQEGLFKVPAPEFEYIVLVIRLILKHGTWDVMLGGEGSLKKAEKNELEYLLNRLSQSRLEQVIEAHFPYIGLDLFQKCVMALQPGASPWFRIQTGQQLLSKLQVNTRYPFLVDAVLKQTRRWSLLFKRRILKFPARHRSMSGGAMIAIVGGDGAGKTTLVENLYKWLAKDFSTRVVHLGKPAESLTTKVTRAVLRLGTLVGLYPHLNSSNLYTEETKARRYPGKYPRMIREACKARDRFLAYSKARRYANNGGIVICDRFPIPQIKLMDGPVIDLITSDVETNRISKFLWEFEQKYYQLITPPELLIVLRLNPDIAVQRKTTEDPAQVHVRSSEIWNADWQSSGAHVIDTFISKEEVLSSAKSLIWSML